MVRPVSSGLRAAIAAAVLVGLAGAASSQTITTKSFAYFPVTGKTAADLDEALSRSGPLLGSTGARHPGATEMKFGGTVTYAELPGRCSIDQARITLDTKIILPRWTQRRRADQDLAMIWDTLAADIKRHEERHAEIARQFARRLEGEVKALRPEADCTAMEAEVAAVTERVLAEHDGEQERFDRVEAINFEARMVRLLEYRLQQLRSTQ